MANDRSDPWPALVLIGVICGITIGTIIMMLRRRDDGGGHPLQLTSGSEDLAMPLSALENARLDPMQPHGPIVPVTSPLARTTQISAAQPTFLLRATGPTSWDLNVRVLGPPGANATFIYSNSTADQFVVPAGAHDRLRLPGYQSLYAVGNVSGVSVSVSGGEAGRA